MVASSKRANIEVFSFTAVPVFKLLGRKALFITKKDNRNC